MAEPTESEPEPEMWRPVEGFPAYEVSSLGRVYSHRTHRLLRGTVRNRHGYRSVTLYRDDGSLGTPYIHALVAAAFLGPRPEKHDTRHLNGDPTDNRLVNLRWGTRQENALDTTRHGRNKLANRERCPLGHPLKAPNLIAWTQRRGWRGCLACSRARTAISHATKSGGSVTDMQTLADAHYDAILNSFA